MGMTELSRKYVARSSIIDVVQVQTLIGAKDLATGWIACENHRGNLKFSLGYENAEVMTSDGPCIARPDDYVFRDSDGHLGVITSETLNRDYENVDHVDAERECCEHDPTGFGVYVYNHDDDAIACQFMGYDNVSVSTEIENDSSTSECMTGDLVTTITLRKPKGRSGYFSSSRPFVEVL